MCDPESVESTRCSQAPSAAQLTENFHERSAKAGRPRKKLGSHTDRVLNYSLSWLTV